MTLQRFGPQAAALACAAAALMGGCVDSGVGAAVTWERFKSVLAAEKCLLQNIQMGPC